LQREDRRPLWTSSTYQKHSRSNLSITTITSESCGAESSFMSFTPSKAPRIQAAEIVQVRQAFVKPRVVQISGGSSSPYTDTQQDGSSLTLWSSGEGVPETPTSSKDSWINQYDKQRLTPTPLQPRKISKENGECGVNPPKTKFELCLDIGSRPLTFDTLEEWWSSPATAIGDQYECTKQTNASNRPELRSPPTRSPSPKRRSALPAQHPWMSIHSPAKAPRAKSYSRKRRSNPPRRISPPPRRSSRQDFEKLVAQTVSNAPATPSSRGNFVLFPSPTREDTCLSKEIEACSPTRSNRTATTGTSELSDARCTIYHHQFQDQLCGQLEQENIEQQRDQPHQQTYIPSAGPIKDHADGGDCVRPFVPRTDPDIIWRHSTKSQKRNKSCKIKEGRALKWWKRVFQR